MHINAKYTFLRIGLIIWVLKAFEPPKIHLCFNALFLFERAGVVKFALRPFQSPFVFSVFYRPSHLLITAFVGLLALASVSVAFELDIHPCSPLSKYKSIKSIRLLATHTHKNPAGILEGTQSLASLMQQS